MPAHSRFERIQRQLLQAWPAESWRDTTVLIGVSGGPDSVALLRLLVAIKRGVQGQGRLIAAHFDHRWRCDSACDARHTKALAAELDLEFRLGSAPPTAARCVHQRANEGREEHARALRYEFLRQTALAEGARWVAVGHTLDDQVETIVHQIARGSGLRGASGMPSTRCLHEAVTLVRPLLEVPRQALRELLAWWRQSFCEDPANESLDYTRTRIRRHVLPAMRSLYAEADQAILRFGRIAQEASEFVAALAQPLLADHVIRNDDHHVELDAAGLRNKPALLVREALMQLWRSNSWPLQDMGYEKWSQLQRLICRPEGGHENLPGRITARCDGLVLRFHREDSGR